MTLRSTSEATIESARAAARARLAQEPDVSSLDLEREARARGAGLLDASEIAGDLAVERLLERYGGPGAKRKLEALDLSPQQLKQIVAGIDPFRSASFGERPQDTVENRLNALITSRRIDLVPQIRADVAIVKQRESGDVPAQARFRLDNQAREASARLEAISLLLGIPRDALIRAADERSIYPERADRMIAQAFASQLPQGTKFDRGQKSISVVSAEAFAEHYRSIAGAEPHAADQLPLLRAGGAILVPIDKDRFGAGSVASIALQLYAHPQLEAKLGAPLATALADHLARRFDDRYSNLIEAGMANGGDQLWVAVSEAVGPDALVEGFFRDPAKLHRSLEERFGSTVFELLAEKASRCLTDVGYVLGRSEIEQLLREQERLLAPGGAPSNSLEQVSAVLARAPQAQRTIAAADLARTFGEEGLRALPDQALALLASLPLRSEALYAVAEASGSHFLERHDLGYAFRQLVRLQEGQPNQAGVELLQQEVKRRGAAKLSAIRSDGAALDASLLDTFKSEALPALEHALGRHLGRVTIDVVENAGTISNADLAWLDPSGAAEERKVFVDRDGERTRALFSQDAGLEAVVEAWLALSASPALASTASEEVAQVALDQFTAFRLDHLLPEGADLFLHSVRFGSGQAMQIFRALDELVESSVKRELGPSADLPALERAAAERWAKLLFDPHVVEFA